MSWQAAGDDAPTPVSPDVTELTEIVAVGGRVTADTLVTSYAAGCFPMTVRTPDDREGPGVVAWFSPDPRAVLTAPGMHVSRSLRRSLRTFTTTIDRAFVEVLEGCADPVRPYGWITSEYKAAYLDLYLRGVAHSVEVWRGDTLVGGLIAVENGGLVCADSKFRRVTDASKAAVAALSAAVFGQEDGERRLIDAQWPTSHLLSLGFQAWPRPSYLESLGGLVSLPPALGGRPPGNLTR